MNFKRTMWALVLVGPLACASTSGNKQADKVTEADMGRLPADEKGPLTEARRFAASAQDQRNEAALALEKANQEVQLAGADEAAAKALEEQAKAREGIASDSREPNALRQARMLRAQADGQREAAKARREYAEKLVEARKAGAEAANLRVNLANQRLELAKVQSLREAGVPAGSKYDLAAFQARVNDAQRKLDEAEGKARKSDEQAGTARAMWEERDRDRQAAAQSDDVMQEGMGSESE